MKERGFIVFDNGTKQYMKNGMIHRDDGPAIEQKNGTKAWYKNGLLHRENGPAIELADGVKMWFLFHKKYTEEEYNRLIKLKAFW